MYKLRQLFSPGFKGSFESSFRFVFLSEGYLASEEELFYKDVISVLQRLSESYPFSLAKKNELNFSAFAKFLSSNAHGLPSSNSNITGNSPFESYFDTNQGTIFYNYSLVEGVINQLYYQEGIQQQRLQDYAHRSKTSPTEVLFRNMSMCLIAILSPTANTLLIEADHTIPAEYYFVFTSVDGIYEQVIERGYFRTLGMGDEFDLDGTEYLAPSTQEGEIIDGFYPNLLFTSSVPSINPSTDLEYKWRGFYPISFSQVVPVHPHPNNSSSSNRILPSSCVTYKKIELYEGGGNYRSQVYRSAPDCLMRRRIGDSTLPVKASPVSLCPVCQKFIELHF